MKPKIKYDIFLSYRREGGQATALLFKERLERAGFRVFYDKDSMHSGVWNAQIAEALESSRDFLLVLHREALDRCLAEADVEAGASGDVMRQEIGFALRKQRNIIPLLLPDFKFPPPSRLPADIRELPTYQGVDVSISHFNETVSRLETLLSAKPFSGRKAGRRWMAAAASVVLAIVIFAFVPSFFRTSRPYPSTREETQQVNEVVRVISRQLVAYQAATEARLELIGTAASAIDNPAAVQTALPFFRKQMEVALEDLSKAKPSVEDFKDIVASPLPIDVYRALFDACEFEFSDALTNLPASMSRYTQKNSVIALEDRRKCVEIAKQTVELNARFYALGVIELLQPVDPSVLSDVKRAMAAYTAIPRLSQAWPRDKETLDIEQAAVVEQIADLSRQLVAIVGKQNMEMSTERKTLEDTLRAAGATPDEIAEIVGGIMSDAAKTMEAPTP